MPVEVVNNRLPQMTENGLKFVEYVIHREGFQMEADMKQSMQGQGTGVVYYRGGIPHQASSPGDSPAIDTGNLVNSIHNETDEMKSIVHIDAEYAGYLEYGTINMAPRPYVAPAVELCKQRLEKIVIPDAVLVNGPPEEHFQGQGQS